METVFGQATPISFEKPIDIKSNGEGKVYVADIAIPGIVVYDLNNSKVELWEKGGDVDTTLAIVPYYIALDRKNNVYAVGTGVKKIYVLDSKGAVINKIDFAGHLKSPGGIVVDDETNRIYLVDLDGKIVVFDLTGKFLFDFGKPGEGEGELNRPIPIAINHKGEVIVGDVMNARVQIFSREGKFLRKFGARGDGPADFQVIKGLAVDSDDNVYVTDGKANQIKIFSTKGEYLMSIGTAYSVTKTFKEAPGGFLLPQGIYIDRNNTIYIADQANMRFQIFRYLGDSEVKK
jgi:DNA-binding beta-propeller fold protein YncE